MEYANFDIQADYMLRMLAKYPKRLCLWAGHPTKRGNTLFQLNSEISEFTALLKLYVQDQRDSLRVRNTQNQQYLSRFHALMSNIQETREQLPKLFAEQLKDPTRGDSVYLNDELYDKDMDELSRSIRQKIPAMIPCFNNLVDTILCTMQALEHVSETKDPAPFLKQQDEQKALWLQDKKNKARITSFCRTSRRALGCKRVYELQQELRAEYRSNPLVSIHINYASDSALMISEIRRGDFTDEQWTQYLEYLCRVDVLQSLEEPGMAPELNTQSWTNHCLVPSCATPQRMRLIQGWMLDCLNAAPISQRVNLQYRNQLFVLYYVLQQCRLLHDCQVPLFLRQITEFSNGAIPDDEPTQRRLSKAIYDESQNWRDASGQLPSYKDLNLFIQQRIGQRKANTFLPRIKYAYLKLVEIKKEW